MSTTSAACAADPVLVALANRSPGLDAVRWLVRLPDDTYVAIEGERVETGDSRRLLFALDDGTEQPYEAGEWVSLIAAPGKVEPVLDQIIRRLHLFGLADDRDIINQGAWLQAQPEWIDAEREHLTDDPTALANSERIHTLRKMGL